MDFYTLDGTFQREDVVDEFESAIWTERFVKAGDFQIVLSSTPERVSQLAEGKFIELDGSPEVMQIETQSIEDDVMTIKGQSLETFFNERWIWTSNDPNVNEWKLRDKPGNVLGTIVQQMAVAGSVNDDTLGIGGSLNVIPYLVVGALTQAGEVVSVSVPFGPMHDALAKIAETYQIGISILISRADAFGYELSFVAYSGADRTTGQLDNERIQFSPALDSMANTKELRSIVGYKTVVVAFPPSWSPNTAPVVQYSPDSGPEAVGFMRRLLVIEASDISQDQITAGVTLLSLMTQKAKDALANNNFTKVIDGEVIPQVGYVYRVNFNLGDIVELVGQSGIAQNARITEFIRSQDATGERAYPTVSVID